MNAAIAPLPDDNPAELTTYQCMSVLFGRQWIESTHPTTGHAIMGTHTSSLDESRKVVDSLKLLGFTKSYAHTGVVSGRNTHSVIITAEDGEFDTFNAMLKLCEGVSNYHSASPTPRLQIFNVPSELVKDRNRELCYYFNLHCLAEDKRGKLINELESIGCQPQLHQSPIFNDSRMRTQVLAVGKNGLETQFRRVAVVLLGAAFRLAAQLPSPIYREQGDNAIFVMPDTFGPPENELLQKLLTECEIQNYYFRNWGVHSILEVEGSSSTNLQTLLLNRPLA